MINAFFFLSVSSVLSYRFLILSIYDFSDHFWVNFISGFSSDLILLSLVSMLYCGANSAFSNAFRLINRFLIGLVSVFFFLFLVGHLRYVEYFGSTVGPQSLSLLTSATAYAEGASAAIDSFNVRVMIGVCLSLTVVFSLLSRDLILFRFQWRGLVVLLVSSAVLNHVNFTFSHDSRAVESLKHNPFKAVYKNFRFSGQSAPKSTLNFSDVQVLRGFLPEKRRFCGNFHPFWQKGLPTEEPVLESHQRTKKVLMDYIEKKKEEKGDWNILIVLQESMRARELKGFSEPASDVTQFGERILSTMQEDGILFTQTFSQAKMTRIGQEAALCSIYSSAGFSIMGDYPETSSVCLSDVFKAKGYSTYFICATENSFDNQQRFHQFHKTDHVIGKEDYPDDAPKGNWGIADRYVLNDALDRLKSGPKPFFSTIMTLSLHLPFNLPEDADENAAKHDDEGSQVRAYIDQAWEEFYQRVRKELPHTIVIFMADHSVVYPGELGLTSKNDFESIKRFHHIPFAILIPDMPEEIAGRSFDNLVAQVDLPPTLLSLLGHVDTYNQFVGVDAFSRTGDIMLRPSSNSFYTVSPQNRNLMKMDRDVISAWSKVVPVGRYAPYSDITCD